MLMKCATADFDVIVAGAGPAGTSAAIHLALGGARVLLVEQKKFPREKLCGEFISPECLGHFARLGVADEMIGRGAAFLRRTVFYSRKGQSVTVPSEWFGGPNSALGLSRARMDQSLQQRARDLGVTVLEETQVADVLIVKDRVSGIRAVNSEVREYTARVTIDATGRGGALARKVCPEYINRFKPRYVAFKAHFENAQPANDTCEIYIYDGGYGGLSKIEHGISNLCFITSAEAVRRCNSDPETVLRHVVSRNSRAAVTLASAYSVSPWLSVALGRYGRRALVPGEGLITVGDAAAFIDPFTGSGILMALECGEIAARAIFRYFASGSLKDLTREYRRSYGRIFDSRLWFSGLLRQAAFVPGLADTAIHLFSKSEFARRKFAHATRHSLRSKLDGIEGY